MVKAFLINPLEKIEFKLYKKFKSLINFKKNRHYMGNIKQKKQ